MNFEKASEQAQFLRAGGRLAEAVQAYQALAGEPQHREAALGALAEVHLQAQRPDKAVESLAALVEEHPESLLHCDRLANLLSRLGQVGAAIGIYLRFIERQPEVAEAHYNLALLLKKQKDYANAMLAYERSILLGIDRVHEVYTNMGVLASEMRRPDLAREMFERAIKDEARYIPALFNLAGHHEEMGEREQAARLFHQILDIDPQHWDSLARLAYATRLTDKDDPLISSLRSAADSDIKDKLAHEGLYFALGKALDDVGEYDGAFAAYTAANDLGKSRHAPYDDVVTEDVFDQLIEWCDADWISSMTTTSTAAPIFICGMFRSGSTLAEQVLAAHPSVPAGGELDILPWLLARDMSPYPERAQNAVPEELEKLAHAYVSKQKELFPEAANVTDKRPDNHMHLGLIKAMFPAARIVYTKREPLDNCLSVYFQQLGGNLSYATDLENIADYYKQQERLLEHWQACFGENIFVLSYDDMVRTPEPVLRELLEFLGLEWDERCLKFQDSANQVKTASVWQVREELHTGSSGRWQNYEAGVEKIKALF
jgi:tetratricopeptide (TPR) repeat protein